MKHNPDELKNILLGLGVVVLMLCWLTWTHPAWSHDIYTDWKTRNGVSCCHERDCAPATAQQDENGNWIARQGGQTYIVPPHAVLSIPSPDGRSHACVISGNVICFVPGEVRG